MSAPNRLAPLFSSNSDEWESPQHIVDEWARVVGPFTLDVAATAKNAKAPRFFTRDDDGLKQDWLICAAGGVAWMNPPYSEVRVWVTKAIEESARGLTLVALLPSRTDTRWFHALWAERDRCAVVFLPGRLRFGDAKNSAPFPSLVAVMRPEGA